jgi:CBS domain containing-hemolysin-like protein
VWHRSSATCASRNALALIDHPDAVIDRSAVRPRRRVRDTLPLPDAHSRLRRSNSHLALVVAIAALEDLVEDLVGAVRDGTHHV